MLADAGASADAGVDEVFFFELFVDLGDGAGSDLQVGGEVGRRGAVRWPPARGW
jgi:hypothetical protein